MSAINAYSSNPMHTEPMNTDRFKDLMCRPHAENHDRSTWVSFRKVTRLSGKQHIPCLGDIVRNFYITGGFIKNVQIMNGSGCVFSAENIDASRGFLIPISINLYLSQLNYSTTDIIIITNDPVACFAEYINFVYADIDKYAKKHIFLKNKQSITKHYDYNTQVYRKSLL